VRTTRRVSLRRGCGTAAGSLGTWDQIDIVNAGACWGPSRGVKNNFRRLPSLVSPARVLLPVQLSCRDVSAFSSRPARPRTRSGPVALFFRGLVSEPPSPGIRKMKTLSLLVHLGLLQTCLGKKCYYPGGEEATGDYPCDSDAEHSACCAGGTLGKACLANKLCWSPGMRFARGSCTDPSFKSPACPDYCTRKAPLTSCAKRKWY
jgi:hypothetical protein